MSDSERNSMFRQPLLALMASLAAFMAIFGVRLPESSPPKEKTVASETSLESRISVETQIEPAFVPIREWDDPVAELQLLLASDQKNANCGEQALRELLKGKDRSAIQRVLKKKLSSAPVVSNGESRPDPTLLILLQIVSGPSHANAKESRTLWAHAFRMGLMRATHALLC
jgi:hypothetical protein